MKEYIKPEIEKVEFTTETVAVDLDDASGVKPTIPE